MNRLISSQAAIDAFYEMASDIDHLCTVGDYVHVLETLSTAKPEQRWIPCSERLPEEGRRVIVYDNERTCIYIASYEANRYYRGSYWEDDEGLICDFEEISAWMPLPEPYRKEGEE